MRYKGKNIYEVLEMTVDEALEFFRPLPRLASKLQTMSDVGLGYVKLGQPSTTLSGGEAQRIKLATELSRTATGRTLYILDEPTTRSARQRRGAAGRCFSGWPTRATRWSSSSTIWTSSRRADYMIDLGPEGGDHGGTIVAAGTPEQVALCPESYTGAYLKKILKL